MSKPTILSPWFVVMRVHIGPHLGEDDVDWYRDPETTEGPEDLQWSNDRTQARLFNSIHSAARVARAVGGYAVVVADEEALKEFRPRGL